MVCYQIRVTARKAIQKQNLHNSVCQVFNQFKGIEIRAIQCSKPELKMNEGGFLTTIMGQFLFIGVVKNIKRQNPC